MYWIMPLTNKGTPLPLPQHCLVLSYSDVDFLPVPEGDDTIHISGNSFVIPCRVNNPNTTVMLELCYLGQRQCEDNLLDKYNRSYEPKTGEQNGSIHVLMVLKTPLPLLMGGVKAHWQCVGLQNISTVCNVQCGSVCHTTNLLIYSKS